METTIITRYYEAKAEGLGEIVKIAYNHPPTVYGEDGEVASYIDDDGELCCPPFYSTGPTKPKKGSDGIWRDDDGNAIAVWEWDFYTNVYLRPNNGVTLENMTWNRHQQTSYDSSWPDGKGGRESNHSESQNMYGPYNDVELDLPHTPLDTDNEELWGLIWLGYEEERVLKMPVMDDDENIYPDNEIMDTLTDRYFATVHGTPNSFDVTIMGSDIKSNLHYLKTRYKSPDYPDASDNGNENLLIWGVTPENHTYTNMVAFSYESDEEDGGVENSSTPDSGNEDSSTKNYYYNYHAFKKWEHSNDSRTWEHMKVEIGGIRSGSNPIGIWNSPKLVKENFIPDDGFTGKNVYIKITHAGDAQRMEYTSSTKKERDNPIDNVTIYVDSYFVVGLPYQRMQEFNQQEKTQYQASRTFSVYTTSKSNGNLSTMEIASSDILFMGEWAHHDENLKKHMWFYDIMQFGRLVIMPSRTTEQDIKNDCPIMYIDLSRDGSKEMYHVAFYSCKDYARETHYYNVITDNDHVFKETSKLSRLPIGNQVWYPIYKPWAECDLWVVVTDENPFPETPEPMLKSILDSRYKKGGETYRKEYYVVVGTDSVNGMQNTAEIAKFAVTKSPFKNEFYRTHGGREEYDKNDI